MAAVVMYELYRGPNWRTLLGGVLGYIAVLPLFIMNAFDLSATVENGLILFGLFSGLLGLTVLVKTW